YRTKSELNVPLGIDVIESLERDLGDVLDVDVFVEHDDAFGEHSLTERPYGVHHFAGLSGIRLLDGNDHQVVKDTFDGKIDVHDLGDGELHQRQENALHSFAHPTVFHRRFAHDGGGIDWILSMSDAAEMKNRIEVFQRIEAGMVAKRPFSTQLIEMDVAFEN